MTDLSDSKLMTSSVAALDRPEGRPSRRRAAIAIGVAVVAAAAGVAYIASSKDREGTEVWLAQTLGLLRLKLSQSDLSDNVDRDPALPRTTKTQTAVSAQLTPRAWPIFGLTYATGDSERTWLTGEGRHRNIGEAPAGAELVEPMVEDGYLLLVGHRAVEEGEAA